MFCKQCGSKIDENKVVNNRCPKCNTTIGKGGFYCSDCGEKLTPGHTCVSKKEEVEQSSFQTTDVKDVHEKSNHSKPVDKRISNNPLLMKIASADDDEYDVASDLKKREAVKMIYGKDVDTLIKEEEERQKAEELERQRIEEEKQRLAEEARIAEEKRLAEEERIRQEKAAQEQREKEIAEQKEKQRLEEERKKNLESFKENIKQEEKNAVFTSVKQNPTEFEDLFPGVMDKNEDYIEQHVKPNDKKLPEPNRKIKTGKETFVDNKNVIVDKKQKSDKKINMFCIAGMLLNIFAITYALPSMLLLGCLGVASVFGCIDVFINSKRSGLGVILASIIEFAAIFLIK